MPDVDEESFNRAAERVRAGAIANSSDADKLHLYGLYSVALKGAPTGPAPSAFNIRESAKYSAWVDASQLSPEQARAEYVKLAERLENLKQGGRGNTFERQAPTGFDIGGGSGRAPKLDLCHWASIGDIRSVQYCLRQESPDYRDEDGLTPLMRAADRGYLEVVDALLDASADLELKDEDGSTALHYAAICGHAVIAGVLILAGADLEAKDGDGATPLELAADAETKAVITGAKAGTWFRPPRPAALVFRRRIAYVVVFAFVMLLLSTIVRQFRN